MSQPKFELIHGDALEELKKIKSSSVDMAMSNEKRMDPRTRRFLDLWEPRRIEIEHLYNDLLYDKNKIASHFMVTKGLMQWVFMRLGIKSRGYQSGPAHHQYRHGKSDKRLYRKVVKKDKCAMCGKTETLGIHHKNDDHYDNSQENLEVLCNSCHMSITKKKWWADKKAGITTKSNAETGWAKPTGKSGKHKTHCPKGHEYAGENLGITKQGQRFCRTCNLKQRREASQRIRDNAKLQAN